MVGQERDGATIIGGGLAERGAASDGPQRAFARGQLGRAASHGVDPGSAFTNMAPRAAVFSDRLAPAREHAGEDEDEGETAHVDRCRKAHAASIARAKIFRESQ